MTKCLGPKLLEESETLLHMQRRRAPLSFSRATDEIAWHWRRISWHCSLFAAGQARLRNGPYTPTLAVTRRLSSRVCQCKRARSRWESPPGDLVSSLLVIIYYKTAKHSRSLLLTPGFSSDAIPYRRRRNSVQVARLAMDYKCLLLLLLVCQARRAFPASTRLVSFSSRFVTWRF